MNEHVHPIFRDILNSYMPTNNRKIVCPDCGGDGVETCHNPDHGFYDMVVGSGSDEQRYGCPCCGHDPRHKMKGSCDTCDGSGVCTEQQGLDFLKAIRYEDEFDFTYIDP